MVAETKKPETPDLRHLETMIKLKQAIDSYVRIIIGKKANS